ncbi:MAG: hypothetical protein R2828_35590 [Saprospiraceae bacterium]
MKALTTESMSVLEQSMRFLESAMSKLERHMRDLETSYEGFGNAMSKLEEW